MYSMPMLLLIMRMVKVTVIFMAVVKLTMTVNVTGPHGHDDDPRRVP